MTSSTGVTAGLPALERMAELCASTSALVEGLRGVANQLLVVQGAADGADGGRPARATVATIVDVVTPLLAVPASPVVGAGVVLGPGVVQDARHCMEWWTSRLGSDAVTRVAAVLDEDSEDFYDYTTLPWFTVPAQTGLPHVTGPYVDWLCTDEYTLTFTAPLFGADRDRARRYLGVVGADVAVSWVERQLLPLLQRSARPTAVVNRQGRVLAGNRPGLGTGSVVHQVDVGALWTGRPHPGARLSTLADLSFALLTLDEVGGDG